MITHLEVVVKLVDIIVDIIKIGKYIIYLYNQHYGITLPWLGLRSDKYRRFVSTPRRARRLSNLIEAAEKGVSGGSRKSPAVVALKQKAGLERASPTA